MHLSLDDISRIPFDQIRMLFTAGSRFSAEPARSTTITAMERAQAASAQVILDLDKRPTLWKDLRTCGLNIHTVLLLVDIAIGTEDEIIAAADQPTVETAVPILLNKVRKAVVVKRGHAGSEIYNKDGVCHLAAPFRVDVLKRSSFS